MKEAKKPHHDIECHLQPKWALSVDDTLIPMPKQKVNAGVIRAQASIANDSVLVRDHNSPNDVIINDKDEVDLAEGNVFYTLNTCEVKPRPACTEPPKLAFFVDDRTEVTVRSSQTGR